MTKDKLNTISKSIFNWFSTVPSVQEETLTDWLKYQVLVKSTSSGPKVKCKLFSKRQEGSVTGADIELIVLTNNGNYAYRIQAKKINKSATENARAFAYVSTCGNSQYDMLINDASSNGMIPLYLFYLNNSGNMICNKYAQNCGVIISDANVYKDYAHRAIKQCTPAYILSMSYPLPCILCHNKKCQNPFNQKYNGKLPDYVDELLQTGKIKSNKDLQAKSIIIVDYRTNER